MSMAICNRDEGGCEIRFEEEEPHIASGGDAAVYKKGAWSKEEDEMLKKAVQEQGVKNWVVIEKTSGLGRPAKNCRLRWLNYLRPNLKKFPFTGDEEKLIVELHSKFGNSWARIANQLPGRSDNEIKNFWHKRAKKCKREKLPIYPSQEKQQSQSHTNSSIIIDEAYNINANCNNNHHTFQPPTPYIVNHTSDNAPFIHSPQSMISTQPQFLSSPTTTLLNTPTSLTHNTLFLSSPSSSSHQPTETDFSISDHLQPPFYTQEGGGGAASLKPPPLLSSAPVRRFLRTKTQFPPHLDSSLQMESPRSPLKLNLSPTGAAAPLSPLKLRLSAPMPLETCVQSNLSIPDAKGELNASSSAAQMTVETDRDAPMCSSLAVQGEPPSIQFSPPENSQVDTDGNLEIMEELRKAQARVRFLKNKLKKKSSRNQHLRSEHPEITLDESSSQSTIKDCSLSRTSSRSDLVGGNAPRKTPRKKDVRRKGDANGISTPEGSQVKKARRGKTESSGSKILSEKSLPKEEDSQSEILRRTNSENILDHLNSQHIVSQGFADKCSSSMEGFLSESSALLQDGFFKGDLYGQTSLIENPFSSQRHAPLVDDFAPVYSQSSATKPGDENGQLVSYFQPDDLGFSFMDDLLMHQNTTSEDLLDLDFLRCEHFSLQNSAGCSSESQLQHQYRAPDLLNSSYQTCKELMEQESQTAKIDESVQHQIPDTSLFDSRYMMGFEHEMEGLFADNLWPQGQMEAHDQTFSVNRGDSVINPMESMMDWNNESASGYTGGYL